MNGLEYVLAILGAYALRDGTLLWWLIHRIIANSTAPVAPATHHPASPPQPAGPGAGGPGAAAQSDKPAVASAPAAGKPQPRFTAITATSFAGGNDSAVSRKSAYTGAIIDGDTELAAALPFRFKSPPIIRAFYQGHTIDAPVRDVGPWNTNDPYWDHGARPEAETGIDATKRRTNDAGIDLTPAAWVSLGYSGDPRYAKAKIDWDFVDTLDGASTSTQQAPAAPPPSPAPSVVVPPWLVLMRQLRDMGVHADHDSAIILGWPGAIGTKFPDMADYAKGYVHDTTPWCGLGAAYVLAMSGIRPQFGATDTDRFLWANAWTQFGTAVTTPQPGDILVFRWAGGGHHVTLYDHEEDDNYYHCTGANQGSGHVVSTEAMPMANCLAIRRPPQQ